MKEAIIQYNDDPNADGNHMIISWKELVRCKDCKNFDGIDCRVNDIVNIMNTDWFCADGERRSENG